MKKAICLILATVLVLSFSFNVFAAEYSYSFTDVNGLSWAYYFSDLDKEGSEATDAGMYFNGTKYSLQGKGGVSFVSGESAISKAQRMGKFGIGFNLTKYAEPSYEIQPYYVLGEEEIKGEAKTVAIPENVAELTSLSVEGINIDLVEGKYVYSLPVANKNLIGTDYSLNGEAPEVTATAKNNGTIKVMWDYMADFDVGGAIRSGNIVVKAISESGRNSVNYVVQLKDPSFIPPAADSDIRSEFYYFPEGVHQGDYTLMYATVDGIDSVMKFDISDLDNIEKAELSFKVAYVAKGTDILKIYKADGNDWNEAKMLSETAPVKGEILGEIEVTADKVFKIDLTDYISEIADSQEFMNVIISTTSGTTTIYSKSSAGVYNKPSLKVAYKVDETANVTTLSSLTVGGQEIELKEGVNKYYLSANELGISGNNAKFVALANATNEAVTTIPEATAEVTGKYYTRDANEVITSLIKEYTVTAKDGVTTKKYFVQIADDGVIPAIEDSDVRSTITGTAPTLYTTSTIHALMKFYIGNLTPETVGKAEFSFAPTTMNVSTAEIYDVPDTDWNELTLTSANAPILGNKLATVTGMVRNERSSCDITEYIAEALRADKEYITLAFGNTTSANVYSSKEGTDSSQQMRKPVLFITVKEDDTLTDTSLASLTVGGQEIELEEGIDKYYLSATELGLTGDNVKYVALANAEGEATTAIPEASVALTGKYYTRNSDEKFTSLIKEYTVTAKDGVTTKKYFVQIADDGVIPAIEDSDVRSTVTGNATTLYTTSSIHSLVKFYIGNLTPETVGKAEFSFAPTTMNVSTAEIYDVPDTDWNELTLTSANAPILGNKLATVTGMVRNERSSCDITEYIAEALRADKEYITLAFGNTTSANVYSSKEGTDSSQQMRKPVLFITAKEDDTLTDTSLASLTVGGQAIDLEEGVNKYYLSANELGINGNNTKYVAVANAEGEAITTIPEATVAVTGKHYTRDEANVVTGLVKEYIVTAKDGLTKERYIVQIATDGYIPVMEDTDVRSTDNLGNSTFMYTTSSIYSLMKFYTGHLNADNIESATLYFTPDLVKDNSVELYIANNSDWDEYTVNLSNAPAYGSLISTVSDLAVKNASACDITEELTRAVLNGDKFMSFIIGCSDSTNYFNTKESSEITRKPHIIITFKE